MAAVQDDKTTSKDEDLPYSSLMSRRLQSFPEPDLEVVVGPNKKVYKYHALILASQSDFVDLMLSSPAAVKARENWRIEFPDVSEELWEKAISYLGPLQKPAVDEVFELLCFYDKYQFHAGKQWCDNMICDYIKIGSNSWQYGYYCDEVIEKIHQLAILSFELKLTKSCKPAVDCAKHRLGRMYVGSAEEILQLLPLVENDEDILRTMVWTVRGRHCKVMSVDEMLEVVKEPNFHTECVEICKRIEESDRWISSNYQRTESIMAYGKTFVHGAGRFKAERNSDFDITSAPHSGGALNKVWFKQRDFSDPANFKYAKIESLDFFGSVWEISMFKREAGDEESDDAKEERRKGGKRIVLWRWDCGHSSLFPPQHGWKNVAGEAATLELSY